MQTCIVCVAVYIGCAFPPLFSDTRGIEGQMMYQIRNPGIVGGSEYGELKSVYPRLPGGSHLIIIH